MKDNSEILSSQISKNKKQKNNNFSLLLVLLLLFVCVVLFLIPQLFIAASGNNNLPVAIHSYREADYSKNNLEIPLVNIGIVSDILRDLDLPPGVYEDRMATITAEIRLAVPTSTGINSVTRTLQPTAAATQTALHISTSTPQNSPSSPTLRTQTRTLSPTTTGTIFTPRPTQKTPTTITKTPTTILKTPTITLKTPTPIPSKTNGLHLGQTPKPTKTPKPKLEGLPSKGDIKEEPGKTTPGSLIAPLSLWVVFGYPLPIF